MKKKHQTHTHDFKLSPEYKFFFHNKKFQQFFFLHLHDTSLLFVHYYYTKMVMMEKKYIHEWMKKLVTHIHKQKYDVLIQDE